MSLEPQKASEEIPEESRGSLRGCLVDGDAEQRRRRRSIRRRSLAISVAVQSAILTALILLSLFGKPQSIALANVTPVPSYSPYRDTSQHSGAQHNPSGPRPVCHVCVPTRISPTIPSRDPTPAVNSAEAPNLEGTGYSGPGAPEGSIRLGDPRLRGPAQQHIEIQVKQPRVVRMTTLDPAMLIHRVDPIYPFLAKQTRREGRVELRARIATDGSIQSLQVVGGDPMFYQSALEAVGQWHYRATILNGQAVEIDTSITVIYTMPH
jgi:TonB family protein